MKVLDKDSTTYIYCLSDPNGEVKYVGKSDNPFKRFSQHLRKAKYKLCYKDRWINSLLEKSKQPELIILDNVSYEDFGFWENYYIIFFKQLGCSLTNTAPGGGGGNFGPEINLKISQKLKGRTLTPQWKEKIRLYRTGRQHKKETLELFHTQRTGKGNSMYGKQRKKEWDENKRKSINQTDLNGSIIITWASIADAVNSTQINRTSINAVLKHKRKTAGGFKWEYSNIY